MQSQPEGVEVAISMAVGVAIAMEVERSCDSTRYPILGLAVGVGVELRIFRILKPNHLKNKHLHWL